MLIRMCGRFTLASDLRDFEESLGALDIQFEPGPRYNIAPTQEISTVLNERPDTVVACRWGLIPSWSKDPAIGARMINARAETLTEKPSFRTPLKRRRCLVLADGFYEWRSVPGRSAKTPCYFRLRHGRPFAFAGLWDTWSAPDGSEVRTCTIITTSPNALVRTCHDRMPAILPPSAYAAWLKPGEEKPETTLALLCPFPEGEMQMNEVSTAVNNVRNDSPACIAPLPA